MHGLVLILVNGHTSSNSFTPVWFQNVAIFSLLKITALCRQTFHGRIISIIWKKSRGLPLAVNGTTHFKM
jgi:hypothetical protein